MTCLLEQGSLFGNTQWSCADSFSTGFYYTHQLPVRKAPWWQSLAFRAEAAIAALEIGSIRLRSEPALSEAERDKLELGLFLRLPPTAESAETAEKVPLV